VLWIFFLRTVAGSEFFGDVLQKNPAPRGIANPNKEQEHKRLTLHALLKTLSRKAPYNGSLGPAERKEEL
jgi:hypothetical protein